MDGTMEHDRIEIGSIPIAVYPAMLGATIAGQFLGIGIDAAIGSHGLWIPAACSVVLEAAVGARYGAARLGHALTRRERGRLSIFYSIALVAVSLPLAGWLAASRLAPQILVAGASAGRVAAIVSIAAGAVAAATGARFALMGLFGRKGG
jgi:hypothetical protein